MSNDSGGKRESQADKMVTLALAAKIELFTSKDDGTAYATIWTNEHYETHPLHSTSFRNFLGHLLYAAEGKAPGAAAVVDALLVLEGVAKFQGPQFPVYTRVAGHDGKIFIDMGNKYWDGIEVSANGFRPIVEFPPEVRFRRARGMGELPMPERGGRVDDLRPFVNVASEEDFILLVAGILAAFRPAGPYPIIKFKSEHGSGKTCAAKFVKRFVDPACPAVRTPPRNEHDLAIAASTNHLLVLDNISRISDQLSDCLCRLATGGGFATREYYTTTEETTFNAIRPVILTGIDEFGSRGDLQDRSLVISMAYITEKERRPETELEREFSAALPKLLGAFLTVVSGALRDLPHTRPPQLPRMADFAHWIAAAEPHLGWAPGTFARVYAANRAEAHHLALESSPVGCKVRELVALRGGEWKGTSGELLEEVKDMMPKATNGKPILPERFPNTARGMSSALSRVAPDLRKAAGLHVSDGGMREPGTGRRVITIQAIQPETVTPVTSEWETI